MIESLPTLKDKELLPAINSMVVSPRTTTILASYNCTAACEHCCFDSHPGIKTRMTLDKILKFIKEASRFKTMKLIVFSGGECFLLGKELDTAIKYATDLGLSTRCVTNGYWATTEESAAQRLRKVIDAGLKEINFSTGDFHQKFVPQSNIVNGALASVKLGLSTVIMVELQKERKVTAPKIRSDPRILDMLLMKKSKKLFKIIESPWMPMSLEEDVQQNPDKYINRNNVYKRSGCDSVFNTIVATPNEQMGLCCGLTRELIPELNADITSKSSLQDIYLRSAKDFMKIWLYVEGPEKILAWAGSKDPTIKWEGKYAHHCHACLALYKDEKVRNVIRKYYNEKVEEVLIRYSLMIRSNRLAVPAFSLSK